MYSRERSIPMEAVKLRLWRFLTREDGPTAVEYAVMLALIIAVCLGAIVLVGQQTNSAFSAPQLSKSLTGT